MDRGQRLINPTAYPVMETFWVAVTLAFISGTLNGYTYIAGKVFSTVQSGNIILVGEAIATHNLSRLVIIFITILFFFAGAATTSLISRLDDHHRKSWSPEILIIETIVVALLGIPYINKLFDPRVVCMIISYVAGMQADAFHKIQGNLYGNVAVTFVVQLSGHYFMRGLLGEKNAWVNFMRFTSVLIGFSLGGLVGTLTTNYFGEISLLISAVFLLGLLIFTRGVEFEEEVIDQKGHNSKIDAE